MNSMEDNTWSIIFLSFQRIPNSLQYLRKRMEHFLEKASHRIFLGQVNLPHQKLSGHLRSVNWWNESIYLFCKRPPPPPPPLPPHRPHCFVLPPFTSTTATFAALDSEQNFSSERRKIGGGDHESLLNESSWRYNSCWKDAYCRRIWVL